MRSLSVLCQFACASAAWSLFPDTLVLSPSARDLDLVPTKRSAAQGVRYAGINIAGFDFGCTVDGGCPLDAVADPGTNGVQQMQHFATNDHLNAFRLPVSWQFLVNNTLGGKLCDSNVRAYDALVKGCIDTAALCIVEVHNYARWNGSIIGQSGRAVTDEHFISLWSQIATKYADEPKVAYGLMNEPHDLNVTRWAQTVQAAVSTIRRVSPRTQTILLPGSSHQSLASFLHDGSSNNLGLVVNLDGTTDNLVFDFHTYLDADGTGTHPTCVTNQIAAASAVATWLQQQGRTAFVSETGGGNTPSCLQNFCQLLRFLMGHSNLFLGYAGWGGGSFRTDYVLSETPTGTYPDFTDQELVSQCIVKVFNAAQALTPGVQRVMTVFLATLLGMHIIL